jgi:hypothetical protein
LGVSSLSRTEKNDVYAVSVNQITEALKDAFLNGEKVGYDHGVNNKTNFVGIFDLV